MPAFKKSGGFKPKGFSAGSAKPRFAKKSFGGARGSSPRERNGEGHDARLELFSATCAKCHKACEVPFRPNGKKPVFCRDCFGDGNDSTQKFSKPAYERAPAAREFSKPASVDVNMLDLKRQMDGMNKKLDAIVLALKDLS